MKTFLDILKCCNKGKENDEYKNLPTMVVDQNDEKTGDKSTSKSKGSINKNQSSSSYSSDTNKKSVKITDQFNNDFKNINFSIIDEKQDYSNSILKEIENLNIQENNTLPKVKNSSNLLRKNNNTISTENTVKISKRRSIEGNHKIQLVENLTEHEMNEEGSRNNINEFIISEEVNDEKMYPEKIINFDRQSSDKNILIKRVSSSTIQKNKNSTKQISFEEECNAIFLKKTSSRKLSDVERGSSTQISPFPGVNSRKISEISFKNDNYRNSGHNNSNNLFTYTNESFISGCSVNLNPNNIVILDSEIKTGKKLIIQDISGDILYGRKLYMDPSGLHNGLRNKRDGFSFFGSVTENSKGEIVNDYIINYYKSNEGGIFAKPNSNNKMVKRLFVIFYDRLLQKYYFRNINDTIVKEKSLIYIKIESQYFIENKKFFLIGQLLINVEPDYKEKKLNISVFFKDSEISKKYCLSIDDSPITIGRHSSNTINIDNSFLSKKQCALEYDKIYSIWKMKDGLNGKNSTHGTWLLVDSKYEIFGPTSVKISNNIFQINFI